MRFLTEEQKKDMLKGFDQSEPEQIEDWTEAEIIEATEKIWRKLGIIRDDEKLQ